MCGTQVSILGLLANDPATAPDGLPWNHAILTIQTDLLSETLIVVPLNNIASMSNCPLVQTKSNKPPNEACVCVWGGGGQIVIP